MADYLIHLVAQAAGFPHIKKAIQASEEGV